jgi:hypothetical protein
MNTIVSPIITLQSDTVSTSARDRCIQSIEDTHSRLTPVNFRATTPITLLTDLEETAETIIQHVPSFDKTCLINNKIPNYTYATTCPIKSHNMILEPYTQSNWEITASCTVSHLRLWTASMVKQIPLVILEHDAIFVNKFIKEDFDNFDGIASLNAPMSKNCVVTRRGSLYYSKIKNSLSQFVPVPEINNTDEQKPQGLPGNSAYYITPFAATKLIRKIQTVGIWPNDAFICKEFFPWLYASNKFYTDLQGTASTTNQVDVSRRL